ncbi:MAG: hypothetical protein KGQ46_14005 [Hyphomicrobiales bacterium]|nr:hypothetical protein [Hyphomicrobiales bacterium]MDE2116028.1 hypothetical protein [Hyphomicrobiales bacterium]
MLTTPSANDALLTPRSTNPAQLHYADTFDTFPPIMTEPGTYPTQTQANYAYQRSAWAQVEFLEITKGLPHAEPVAAAQQSASAIHLFACGRGSLNGLTGRVERFGSGPVVTCATDFLDENNQVMARRPINFYYYSRAWHMLDPHPSYRQPAWRTYTRSPPHNWNPFGERY